MNPGQCRLCVTLDQQITYYNLAVPEPANKSSKCPSKLVGIGCYDEGNGKDKYAIPGSESTLGPPRHEGSKAGPGRGGGEGGSGGGRRQLWLALRFAKKACSMEGSSSR